jgi:hypothetical protein
MKKLPSILAITFLVSTLVTPQAHASENGSSLWAKASNEISEYVSASPSVEPLNPTYFMFSPSLNAATRKHASEILQRSFRTWSPLYVPSLMLRDINAKNSYVAIIYASADLNWAQSKADAFIGGSRSLAAERWSATKCNGGNAGNGWSFTGCLNNSDVKPIHDQLIGHEYTHSVQQGVACKNSAGCGLPSWLSEGVATFYGWITAFPPGKASYSSVENALSSSLPCGYNLKHGGTLSQSYKKRNAYKTMINIEKLQDDNSFLQYGYGAIATTILLANHGGQQSLNDFYSNFDKDRWRDVFEESFHISVDDFYKEVSASIKKFDKALTCTRK